MKNKTKTETKKQLKNIKISKVQEIVNLAIRERDGDCVVRDGKHQCKGVLTASHYFSVGGNSTWRFYPPNIHCQCFGHHGVHERRQEPFFYTAWMERQQAEALEYMTKHWGVVIRYTQPIRAEIKKLAQAGELDKLQELIEGLVEGEKVHFVTKSS